MAEAVSPVVNDFEEAEPKKAEDVSEESVVSENASVEAAEEVTKTETEETAVVQNEPAETTKQSVPLSADETLSVDIATQQNADVDQSNSNSAPESMTTSAATEPNINPDGLTIVNKKVDEIVIPKATITDPIDDKNQAIFTNVEGLENLTGKTDGTMPQTKVDGGSQIAYITARSKTGGDILYVGYIGKNIWDEFRYKRNYGGIEIYSICDSETIDPGTLELHYVVENTNTLKTHGEVSFHLKTQDIDKARKVVIKSLTGLDYGASIKQDGDEFKVVRHNVAPVNNEHVEVVVPIKVNATSNKPVTLELADGIVKVSYKVFDISKMRSDSFIPIYYQRNSDGKFEWKENAEIKDKIGKKVNQDSLLRWLNIDSFGQRNRDGDSSHKDTHKPSTQKTLYQGGNLTLNLDTFEPETLHKWGYSIPPVPYGLNQPALINRIEPKYYSDSYRAYYDYLEYLNSQINCAFHLNDGSIAWGWKHLSEIDYVDLRFLAYRPIELKDSSHVEIDAANGSDIDIKNIITNIRLAPVQAWSIPGFGPEIYYDVNYPEGRDLIAFSELFIDEKGNHTQSLPFNMLPTFGDKALNLLMSDFRANTTGDNFLDWNHNSLFRDLDIALADAIAKNQDNTESFNLLSNFPKRLMWSELTYSGYKKGDTTISSTEKIEPASEDEPWKYSLAKPGAYSLKIHWIISPFDWELNSGDPSGVGELSVRYDEDALLRYKADEVTAETTIYVDGTVEEPKTVTRTIRIHVPDAVKRAKLKARYARTNALIEEAKDGVLVIKQVANPKYTYFLNAETRERKDAKWVSDVWDSYTVPTYEGWTPNKTVIESMDVTGDGQDTTVDIFYTKDLNETKTVTRTINVYALDGSVNANKQVVSFTRSGKATTTAEGKIKEEWEDWQQTGTWDAFSAPKVDGWTATKTIDPEDVQLDSKDTTEEIFYSRSVPEGKTVTRTIRLYLPDGTTRTEVQKATLSRTTTETTTKTGVIERSAGEWSTGAWEVYKAPNFEGWSADKTEIEAVEVTVDTKDSAIEIHYTKDKSAETEDHESSGEKTDDVDKSGSEETETDNSDDKETEGKKGVRSPKHMAKAKVSASAATPQTGDATEGVAGVGIAGLVALLGSLFVRKGKKQE